MSIEAIGAYIRGTELHYYSNAGVTTTGQEPSTMYCQIAHHTRQNLAFRFCCKLQAENEKPERIERNFLKINSLVSLRC